MTIDWSKYTPREIRLALETAPLVAGPWRRIPLKDRPLVEDWRRCGCSVVAVPTPVAQVWCYGDETDGYPTYVAPCTRITRCESISDGKAKADAALREAGWILDDEEDKPGGKLP